MLHSLSARLDDGRGAALTFTAPPPESFLAEAARRGLLAPLLERLKEEGASALA